MRSVGGKHLTPNEDGLPTRRPEGRLAVLSWAKDGRKPYFCKAYCGNES